MSSADDDFRPRLGRMRSAGARSAKRYLGKLYARMEKAKPGVLARKSSATFSGARIGRGAGRGAAFAMRVHPFAKFRSRRVTVKIRSVRLGTSGLAKARAHLRYIQRDGAEMDGSPGTLYGATPEPVDGDQFLENGNGDRHQFRIILAPEDGSELQSLDQFTRDVMAAAEKDLGTRLDWVAVNHFDTDHPHVHIVLRGRADDGGDLIIAKSYIAHGFRGRAEEFATLELGPRRDLEIARARFRETGLERFTSLDRDLLNSSANGVVDLGSPRTIYDRFRAKLLAARLRALESMNLARRDKGVWRLSPELERTLREAGRRGDIIRSMGAALGRDLALATVREFGTETAPERLIGRIAGSGAADEAHDRRFLTIEGADGNQWRVVVALEPGGAPPQGAIVEVSRAAAEPRKSDRMIAAIAERNGGVYSDAFHAATDPTSSAEYRLAHKRRLEALRRAGVVDREPDGSWRIPKNYLDRAAAFEGDRTAARVRVMSWVKLEELPEARAQIFLDDALEGRRPIERVPSGFGADLDEALRARRRWLIANSLATDERARFEIDRGRLRALERQSLDGAGDRLSRELRKAYVQPVTGERIAGVYRRTHDLPSGRFALVERSKEFMLVPWREALERRRGMEVSGAVTRGGVNWSFDRGAPGIGR